MEGKFAGTDSFVGFGNEKKNQCIIVNKQFDVPWKIQVR
jgi:hypothetical protein